MRLGWEDVVIRCTGRVGLSDGFGIGSGDVLGRYRLAIVSSSVMICSGPALGDGVVLDEVVETKFRRRPNIDLGA